MNVVNNRPMPYDWPRLLEDLAHLLGDADPVQANLRAPLSEVRLAIAIGYPRNTVVGWRNGSQPRHDDGEMILERWCSLTGKSRIFAPRERRPLSAAST